MSRPGPDEARGASPAALLAPERCVVPFTGRGRELAELRSWVRSREPVALRLLSGLGGVGKTRLALELGRRLRRTGWTVVHVPSGQEVATVERVADVRRVLLVVDDAGFRAGLPAMLDAIGATRWRGRLRVLLLARTGGQWWPRERWTSSLWAGGTPSVTQMALDPALEGSLDVAYDPALDLAVERPDGERAVIEAAASRFARALGRPVPRIRYDPAPDRRPRVLDLHAAALVAVLDGDLPDPAAALGVVLERERAGWTASAAAAGLLSERSPGPGPAGEDVTVADAVLTVATLLGDTSDDGLRAALRRAGAGAAPGREADVLAWVRAHLPAVPRLGELLVSRVLAASAGLAARCTSDLDADQAFAVLGFAAAMGLDRPTAERDVTGEVIEAVAAALPAGSAADLPGLLRVIRRLPRSSGPLVVPVLDRLTHRAAELSRTAGGVAQRAEALSDLGTTLVAEGDPDAAVVVLREAVGLWRELSRDDADRYRPPLCTALNNLGMGYWAVGRHGDALTVQEEVVALCRRFPPGDGPWADAEHARALQNAGVSYTELGRTGEIEAAQRASLDLYRRLAAGDPVQYEPRLAAVLGNFEALTESGRPEDALPANVEAVAIRRRLAADRPEHLAELAWSLGQLGTTLEALGRYEEAGVVLVEALEIQRRLAKENERGTRPDLAGALSALGALYSTVGRADESLRLEREALEIRRDLAREHPEKYLYYLAHSLSNLGVTLARRGRYDEAVLLEEEAVAVRRELARENARSLKYLAQSLSNLGVRYADLGRFEEALRPTQEAVDMLRRLVREEPEKYRAGLAEALANLGATLLDLGRADESLRPMREAVVMRRALALENPDKHRPDLALALSNLASALSAVGDNVTALGHAREAVEMRRRLAADLPERYRAELERSRGVLTRIDAAIRNPPPAR
ncbi:tetratricopeptide repeat protein [Promicromonospora sp. NPDC050880]|uniref:tetratricopeptide repeat protein n=1 Tax=Promicromonospora sp. NPDC050880 TaxID=3364406 RepID=UPI00379EB831